MRIEIEFRDRREPIVIKNSEYEFNENLLVVRSKKNNAVAYFPIDCLSSVVVWEDE